MTPQIARNARILALYREGHSLRELGERFGLVHQRIHSIVLALDASAIRPAHVGMNMSAADRKRLDAPK